ncbi:DNA polymerase phi, partial [Rhizoctonia solani]
VDPEKLGLTVTFQDLAPNQPWKDILAPTFRNPALVSSPNLPVIARILKETDTTEESDVKSTSGGTFKVQLHSVWTAILEIIKTERVKPHLQSFTAFVLMSLFATTSSSERKSWGFQVFERALTIMPSEEYQYLFTPNFMRTWINHLSAPDRHLHKAAKKAASDIVKAVERNPSIGFSLVTHLQGAHGNQQFDRITRTKTVETILASTDIDGVKKYTTSLVNQLRDGVASDAEPTEQDSKRRYVFEQLAALMRNGSIPKDDEWIKSVLELFILHGESGESTRTNSSAADGELWITKSGKIGDVIDLRARARKVLKSIRRRRRCFPWYRTLDIRTVTRNIQRWEDNVDSLESCLDATEKLFNLSKEVKSSEEDEHSPIDLLIDVIIGMLEKSSAFGKSVATQAFGLLSGRVESTTIDLILLQLEQRDVNESENGEDEDEAAEAVDEMAEAEEDDEDEKSEDDSDSDSDDDSTDGDENEELEVDPEFRKQVAEALRVNGMAIAEDEDEDSDSDSEEEVLLDDDQMMQLDEQLAKVFRAHAGGSKEKKSAQREATHFKIRILDLVDIFLSKQPQSAYAPRVVLPLVNIAISAGPMNDNYIPTGEIDKEATIKDLRDLHELARKTPIPELSACSIYLSKVLQGDLQVLEAYRASIEDFARRKNSKLSPILEGIHPPTNSSCLAAKGAYSRTVKDINSTQCQEAEVVEQLFSFIPLIRDALYKSLTTACEQTEHSANAAQVKELLKIALQAMRLARKVARPSDSISSSWDVSAFEKVREQLANSDRFKGSPAIQSSTKQVLSLLVPTSNGTVPTNKKRKETAEEVTINGTETEPRKKRKKVKKQKIDRTATND